MSISATSARRPGWRPISIVGIVGKPFDIDIADMRGRETGGE